MNSNMSNMSNEFFTTSADREANRELAHAISAEVVAALRPDEAIFTEYAFDPLMDLAAQGKVAHAGSGPKFGFGGADLLMMVVVPAVTSALTASFVCARAAGLGGIEEPPTEGELVSRAELERIARQSGVRVRRGELDRLYQLVNSSLREGLLDAVLGLQHQSNTRCCGYDCGALRRRLAAVFTVEELRTLCFDLGEPHSDAIREGVPLSSSARDLIEFFIRRGRICNLVALARERRLHLDWSNLP